MAYYPPAPDTKRPPIVLSYHEPPTSPPPYTYQPSGPPPRMAPYPPPSGPPQLPYPDSEPSGANYAIQSFPPVPDVARRFNTPKLPLPLCVPQLVPGFDGPFCRAYNPTLESVGLPQEQLLAFVDGLNLAMSESPPHRVVNLAGMDIVYAPYHWADSTRQTGNWADMRVLSKTTTDLYLRAANLRLFKPHGLSVRLCTAAAMQHLIMGAPIVPAPSRITRLGRGVSNVLMNVPIPLASLLVNAKAGPGMAPASRRSTRMQAAQRRAALLQGYALPLDFDMPQSGRNQPQAENLRPEHQQGYRSSSQQGYGEPSHSSRGGLIGGLLSMGSDQVQRRASKSQSGRGGLIRGLISMGSDQLQQRGSGRQADQTQAQEQRQQGYDWQSQSGRGGLISGLISMGSEQLQQRGSGRRRNPPQQQGYSAPCPSGRGSLISGLVSMGSDQLQQRGANRGDGDRGSGRRESSGSSDDEDRRGGGGKRASRRDDDRKSGLVGLLGGLVMSHVGGQDQGGRTPPGGRQTNMGSRAINLAGGDRHSELQVTDSDLIEQWQSSKVLWVVIADSDTGASVYFLPPNNSVSDFWAADDAIKGIERAESREDAERIEEQTWHAEMYAEQMDRDFDVQMERVAASQ
ncbi:hypothetical protein C8R47DRAFT_628769 [Mycena vitilis]|nr:hypothetical protein C8R47DRAFT_628769 [Mycena vitilis]